MKSEVRRCILCNGVLKDGKSHFHPTISTDIQTGEKKYYSPFFDKQGKKFDTYPEFNLFSKGNY